MFEVRREDSMVVFSKRIGLRVWMLVGSATMPWVVEVCGDFGTSLVPLAVGS